MRLSRIQVLSCVLWCVCTLWLLHAAWNNFPSRTNMMINGGLLCVTAYLLGRETHPDDPPGFGNMRAWTMIIGEVIFMGAIIVPIEVKPLMLLFYLIWAGCVQYVYLSLHSLGALERWRPGILPDPPLL